MDIIGLLILQRCQDWSLSSARWSAVGGMAKIIWVDCGSFYSERSLRS